MSQPPADTRPGWSTRRKVWTVVGAVVAVIVVMVIVGNIVGPPPAEPQAAAPTSTGAAIPTLEEPISIAPPPPATQAPPRAQPAAKPRPTSLAQIDAALTPAEKRDYALRLQAVAPSVQAEFDKFPGDVDTPAKFLSRNGVQLCNRIAEGLPDDVLARETASRFDVSPADVPAVRSTTERMVCPKLA